MELLVFPIPIPPPTSLSSRFLWVFPVPPGIYLHSPIMELVGFSNEGKIDGHIPSIRNGTGTYLGLKEFNSDLQLVQRAMLVKLSLFLYTYAMKSY